MPIKLASVASDLDREKRGDWIECPDLPGVTFKVSSIHLPAYATARDVAMQKLSRQYKNKVPRDVVTTTIGKLYAEHLLHDWRGFDEPYSPELAGKIMTDPAYRTVISAVEWCANQIAQPDIEFLEDESGNSEAPSAGD